MSDEILKLFEGLTPKQFKEFRKRLVPALTEFRNEIIKGANKMSYNEVSDEDSNTKLVPIPQVDVMESNGE